MSARVDETIIVGAGPAGTSAALALAARGRPVRLLDAGRATVGLPPAGDYFDLRFDDPEQWRWQLGRRFEALAAGGASSPKLRVPGLQGIFAGFAQGNRIRGENGFRVVGALAAGGLSNAWGCGVATFRGDELGPLDAEQRRALQAAYARAALRMGLSGSEDDQLRQDFGLDEWAAPALPMDALHRSLWRHRGRLRDSDFRLGRARVAVLGQPQGGRRACDLSGMCLWGCARGATWSAAIDVAALKRMDGVAIESGVLVERLHREGDSWSLDCKVDGVESRQYRTRRVLLAAGTLASTRLVLQALPSPPPEIRLLSNPMAAFLLLLPGALGRGRERAFGLAQLSFVLDQIEGAEAGFGNLFSTGGIPVADFLEYLPLTRRAGLPLLRGLLPATVVGNVFLPGSLSAHRVQLDAAGSLCIRGGHADSAPVAMAAARSRLAAGFRRMGAWMLPGSFVPGEPGADLHYAGTLPMREQPRAWECSTSGEVAGLPGVFVLDGAVLPMLPAKAHTLTIMANADRIASQWLP